MKCLTIKEKYLLQILNGTKKIEFRTWKTKYRDDLYLHCSKYKSSIENGGKIIAKCKIKDIKYNEKDRIYEWELIEIQILKNKIPAKGKLSIWNNKEVLIE